MAGLCAAQFATFSAAGPLTSRKLPPARERPTKSPDILLSSVPRKRKPGEAKRQSIIIVVRRSKRLFPFVCLSVCLFVCLFVCSLSLVCFFLVDSAYGSLLCMDICSLAKELIRKTTRILGWPHIVPWGWTGLSSSQVFVSWF